MLQPNIIYLIFFIFVTRFLSINSSRLAPALYVLGDSLVDNGNNNMLPTFARANYAPYSINFPTQPLGRFTDGRTVADFIAAYLGLPYPPPYASLLGPNWKEQPKIINQLFRENSTRGYNYASAACGILPETGYNFGKCYPMDEQIQMFESTIDSELAIIFKDPGQVFQHLAKSIFVICVGNNDYLQNYFQDDYPSSKLYDPHQFAQILVDKLCQQLKRLYELGARKVLVTEIGPLGCIPTVARNPKRMINLLGNNNNGICDEDANNIVSAFNKRLPFVIQKLSSTFPDSHFTVGSIYANSYDAITSPSKYGFNDGSSPCCTTYLNGMLLCIPYQAPCQDPSKHIFWDGYHPTEVVFSKWVTQWIQDSSTCFPINFKQFVEA